MHDFDAKWNYNDPKATEQIFRTMLDSTSLADDQEYYLELQTQIARTLGLQQNFKEAHALLDSIFPRLNSELPTATIRYHLERGRTYNSSNHKDDARRHFIQAWEMALTVSADFYAVDAAHMMAIIEPPEEQLAWNEKAQTLAENSADPRAKGWLGSLYNNIGWTYHDLGNYEKALEIFLKAQAWREEHKQVQETQIAKWCVARTHRSLGNVEQALSLQLELEMDIQTSGNPEDGYVAEEIAECLSLLGKTEQAAPYFLKAWDLLSKDIWLQQNEKPRLERLEKLGKTL